MRPADGGAVAVPPGDPAGVREGARALVRAGGAMGAAARRTTGLGLSGSRDWSGPASSGFVARTVATAGGLDRLGEGFAAAGRALEEYAEVLEGAQRRAQRAQAAWGEAVQQHAHDLRAAAEAGRAHTDGMTEDAAARATQAAREAQHWAQARAEQALRRARAHVQREAEQAQEDVDAAARRAAWRLGTVVDDLRAATVRDLLEWLGGPDTAFGLLGLFGQGVSAKALLDARKALVAGDFATLARLDPDGYAQVVRVAAQHGATSLQALNAQAAWESRVLTTLVGRMHEGALPLQGLPAGKAAAALDLLGKLGLVTSVVSNAYTVFGDDDASTSARVAAGLNTAGLVAIGTGSSTAMGLVGLSASTGWIPVAGQVVVAVTAAYLAYDWYRENREAVHAFFDEVGDGIGDAVDWTGRELRQYADEVRRELETARSTLVGVGQDAVQLGRDAQARGERLLQDAREGAGELLEDADRRLDDARDAAGRVLDDARDDGARLLEDAQARGEQLRDDAGELLEDAGALAGDARRRAGRAVSAVNPFD